MLNQNEVDNHSPQDPIDRSAISVQASTCYAIVSRQLLDEHDNLLDRVIDFAFDTLGLCHLEVRVYDEK